MHSCTPQTCKGGRASHTSRQGSPLSPENASEHYLEVQVDSKYHGPPSKFRFELVII